MKTPLLARLSLTLFSPKVKTPYLSSIFSCSFASLRELLIREFVAILFASHSLIDVLYLVFKSKSPLYNHQVSFCT